MPVLRRAKGLAWFKNEHDETPAAILSDLSAEEVARLADELTRTRDGQLVLGRRGVRGRGGALEARGLHAGRAGNLLCACASV